MRNDELELIHKCHSCIGNSLDLKLMLDDVIQTLITHTHSSYVGFYLKDEETNELELIWYAGNQKSFDIGEYERRCDSFEVIQKNKNEKVIILPLKRGVFFITYKTEKMDMDFLSSLLKGMVNKLNISIDSCLNVEQLQEKNEKLKILAKELARQRHQLMDSNRFKDVFLANMSHELKTPLNSILVISSVMAKNKQKKLDEEQVRNLEIINDCGNDLLFLINDVLDISKLEAGEMLLELDEADILKTLNDLKQMFDPLMHKKGLEFVCEFDEDTGNIYTDINKVRQIIKNLLSNALKFVSIGKIRLRLQNCENSIKLVVKDDGIGIPENKLEHIFDRFKQVDESTSRKFGGSGLGLAICKELAVLLGGDIVVNSKLNKGATFTLTLPKYLKKDYIKSEGNTISIKDVPVKKLIQKDSLEFKSKMKDILVISDDYVSFFTTYINLKKEGITIHQLHSLAEASLLLENQVFDVLILKHKPLEDMSFDLLKKAKEFNIKTVVITDDNIKVENVDTVIKEDEIQTFLVLELMKL